MLYLVTPGAGALGPAWALDPAVVYAGFAGLSGVAHGLMAITALAMIKEDSRQRLWGIFSLIIVVCKSSYELRCGQAFFEFMHMGLYGHPIAASHAGGVWGGMSAYGGVQMGAGFWRRIFALAGTGLFLPRA